MLAIAVPQAACYKDPYVAFKTSRLEVAPSPPVHVANRVDVKLEGQTLVTTATPLCARASTGEYVVINETRRDKDGSKWGAAAGLAIGIGELTTAHYLWDTDYRVVGAMMLGFGSLMTLLGVTNPRAAQPARDRARARSLSCRDHRDQQLGAVRR